ncbi:E3 SUMO-protein ligase ZBED1-like isoform X2 [Pseudophryne corroboree]|uniref:E3 SUMO-protein ligase ZBED1-like isoform X2 n=1 Tax=Pseudophryne corroboree TaxID=495146 RepID=UPI003082198C
MRPKSIAWNYFDKTSEKTALCRLCGTHIKTCGNTTNLNCHLKSKHSDVLQTPVPGSAEGKIRLLYTEWPSINVVQVTEEDETAANLLSEAAVNLIPEPQEQQPPPQDPGPSTPHPQIPQTPVHQDMIARTLRRVHTFKETVSESNRITQAIVYMICKDSEPFNIVELPGFIDLLNTLAPQYEIPTRKSIKNSVIEKYYQLSNVMREKLVNKKCTLTTEVWADDQRQSYLSLTVHFYDLEDVLFSGTLGVLPLEETHTGENLADQLRQWCRDWGIRMETDHVMAVVTDSGASVKKAVEVAFGEKKHIPCFAHNLNFVVEKCLEIDSVSTLVTKAKDIVAWFKQSLAASEELRKLDERKLIRSVAGRWISTFHMLQRLLELQPHIGNVLARHPGSPPMLTDAELEDVTEVLAILDPFESATQLISGEHYLSSSMVIPIASLILDKLEKLHPSRDIPKGVLAKAVSGMKKKFGRIEHVFLLAIATVLDPRFKKLYFRDPTALSKQITFLSNKLKKGGTESAKGNDLSASVCESEDIQKPSRDLFSDHNNIVQKTWQQREESPYLNMPQELSMYLVLCPCFHGITLCHLNWSAFINKRHEGAPPEKIEENPLRFWKQMEATYPNLTSVARRYLTTVATCVPADWLFSKAGEIKSRSRNRITGKLLPKLLFLQSIDDRLWGV